MFCFKSDISMSALLRVPYGWLETPALKVFQSKNYGVAALCLEFWALHCPIHCRVGENIRLLLEETLSPACRHSLASSGELLSSSVCRAGMVWIPRSSPEQSQPGGSLGVRCTDLLFHCLHCRQLTHSPMFASLPSALDSKALEDMAYLVTQLSVYYSVTISGRMSVCILVKEKAKKLFLIALNFLASQISTSVIQDSSLVSQPAILISRLRVSTSKRGSWH